VLVLERAAQAGGAARTRAFAPGFSVSSGAHLLTHFPEELIGELQLQRHGLRLAARELATVSLQADGRHLVTEGPHASGPGLSAEDEQAFARFHADTAAYAAILAGADRIIARRQEAIVTSLRDQRRIAEEMAMQDLRADLDDIVPLGDARFRVTIFLQNHHPERPLFVLGPTITAAVQRDGSWSTVALDGANTSASTVRPIEATRTSIDVDFTSPDGSYDELIRGYLHLRFSASMVVSEQGDGTGDLFERLDAYYAYLRDPRLTEEDVRRLNSWPSGSTVPAWIAMPAH
jgi:putative ABC transport system ATP-binding protein/macrolide transport system ATP-binding/permease protein/lipoprotein-releasing system ATP-binding protein